MHQTRSDEYRIISENAQHHAHFTAGNVVHAGLNVHSTKATKYPDPPFLKSSAYLAVYPIRYENFKSPNTSACTGCSCAADRSCGLPIGIQKSLETARIFSRCASHEI